MEIDLSALDRLTAPTETPESMEGGKHTDGNKNPAQAKIKPPAGRHYVQLEAERETARRMSDAYKEYQENIKRGGECMTAISKGIKEGENLYTLLLLAVDGLSKMTSNRLFYDQSRAELQAIYGALGYAAPIAHRAQDVQERLSRLSAALEREQGENDRDRIKRAIRAHRIQLEELQEQLKKADK